MNQILIVEDESVIRSALKRLLERHRYDVSDAESVDDAMSRFQLDSFSLIISDLRLGGRPGTDLIDLAGEVPVLIMTSYASMRSAIDAMKQGAADYIAKPFDHDDMLKSVKQIIESNSPIIKSAAKNSPIETGGTRMYGNSKPMRDLQGRIQKVAKTEATVLIQGESGTGKELAARSIHELSNRNQAPMISVNCAAIPETLIESELFGHEKGAFTGAVSTHSGLIEAADGGTLFLDEIGELPLEAQARLLRVLQEGEIRKVGSVKPMKVDIRLIAATHRDLKTLTRNGQFREDLFYRLYIMEIAMPALRDRGQDIIDLAEQFLIRNCERMSLPKMHFNDQARNTLAAYSWPGNVRELENAVERAVILCDHDEIGPELLNLEMERATHSHFNDPAPTTAYTGQNHSSNLNTPAPTEAKSLSLEDYFQRFVLDNEDKMTETELAKQLGISRKTLWERRQKLGIPRKK